MQTHFKDLKGGLGVFSWSGTQNLTFQIRIKISGVLILKHFSCGVICKEKLC